MDESSDMLRCRGRLFQKVACTRWGVSGFLEQVDVSEIGQLSLWWPVFCSVEAPVRRMHYSTPPSQLGSELCDEVSEETVDRRGNWFAVPFIRSLIINKVLPTTRKDEGAPVLILRRHMGKWRYSSTDLDFGTRWKWVVCFTHRLFYPGGRVPLPIG
jgi:hypothetical protein